MLRKLKINNFCQHVGEREFNFSPGTVGIIGRSGSGKSNLSKSIAAGITGRFFKNKDAIVTRGKKGGYVEVTFDTYTGESLTVHRGLSSNIAIVQSEDGKELACGAKEVNALLLDKIGVPLDVLGNLIFVGQEEIHELLFSSSNRSGREKIAQAFFGVDKARTISDELTRLSKGLSGPETIEAKRSEIKMLSEMIDQLNADIRNLENEISTIEIPRGKDKLVSRLSKIKSIILSKKSIDRLNSEIHAYEGIIEKQRKEILDLEEEIADFDVLAEERKVAKNDEAINRNKDRDNLRKDIERINEKTKQLNRDLSDAQASLEMNRERFSLLEYQSRKEMFIQRAREDIISSDNPVCEVCLTELSKKSLEKIETQHRIQNVESTTDQTKEIKKIKNAIDDYTNIIFAVSVRIKNYEGELEKRRSGLCELGEANDRVFNLQGTKDAIAIYHEIKSEINEKSEKVDRFLLVLEEKRKELEINRSTDVSEEDPEEEEKRINKELSYIEKVEAEVMVLTHEVSVKRKSLGDLKKVIDAKVGELESLQMSKKKGDLVSSLREVFHYNGAPQIVVRNRLAMIGDRINYYLDILGARYRTTPSSGLNFTCEFSDGLVVDSSELSGGEKTMLAIAFRLASCESFCSKVGFMIFDEPTAWLDSDTVERMGDVIDRLSDIGRDNNFQFIIVTHSQSLIPMFNSVIQL